MAKALVHYFGKSFPIEEMRLGLWGELERQAQEADALLMSAYDLPPCKERDARELVDYLDAFPGGRVVEAYVSKGRLRISKEGSGDLGEGDDWSMVQ